VFVDRYTGWPGVIMGATGFDITKFLAKLCEDYRVPVSCEEAAEGAQREKITNFDI
jgi:hypothetical protein